MLIRILLLIISLVILSACVQDPQGFLRKSANNKYFDMKGFHESKRLPVYNAKYIERAKENILSAKYSREDNIEVDEPDEVENPQAYHREIYKQMAIGDGENHSKFKKKSKKRKKQKQSFYSKIANLDVEEYDDQRITSKTVKISDPLEVSYQKPKDAIMDDFGDEIEYSQLEKEDDSQLDVQEEKIDVKEVLSKELEVQKKQMQKEFDEMKALLKSKAVEPEEKENKINVKEIVSKELSTQKHQLEEELAEMKFMLQAMKEKIAIAEYKKPLDIRPAEARVVPSSKFLLEKSRGKISENQAKKQATLSETENIQKPIEAQGGFLIY
jgi:hypothetical protein